MKYECKENCGRSVEVAPQADSELGQLTISYVMCNSCSKKYEQEHPGTIIPLCPETDWAYFSELALTS